MLGLCAHYKRCWVLVPGMVILDYPITQMLASLSCWGSMKLIHKFQCNLICQRIRPQELKQYEKEINQHRSTTLDEPITHKLVGTD